MIGVSVGDRGSGSAQNGIVAARGGEQCSLGFFGGQAVALRSGSAVPDSALHGLVPARGVTLCVAKPRAPYHQG